MASEEQKKENQLRLAKMILLSLASSAWDTLGETSFAFSGPMGECILEIMEKEMGLEIAGESPEDVMAEVGRIFVDEFGFCGDIDVETDDNSLYTVKVKQCIDYKFVDQLEAAGVEKSFICPIMNACHAALRRMGYKMREDLERWHEQEGSIITFKAV